MQLEVFSKVDAVEVAEDVHKEHNYMVSGANVTTVILQHAMKDGVVCPHLQLFRHIRMIAAIIYT